MVLPSVRPGNQQRWRCLCWTKELRRLGGWGTQRRSVGPELTQRRECRRLRSKDVMFPSPLDSSGSCSECCESSPTLPPSQESRRLWALSLTSRGRLVSFSRWGQRHAANTWEDTGDMTRCYRMKQHNTNLSLWDQLRSAQFTFNASYLLLSLLLYHIYDALFCKK